MIGKVSTQQSFRVAQRYIHEKEGAVFLDSNCASANWQDQAEEMEVVAQSNSKCENPVFHLSLSEKKGVELSHEQWIGVAKTGLESLGLQDNQYSIVLHTDSENPHIHIVVNRVNSDGKAYSCHNSYEKVNLASRAIEKKHGLESITNHINRDDGRMATVRTDLKSSIFAAKGRGLEGLAAELNNRGYNLKSNVASTGRISGISIQSQRDGKTWKASEIQPGGWRSIEKQLDAPEIDSKRFKPLNQRNPIHTPSKNKLTPASNVLPRLRVPGLPSPSSVIKTILTKGFDR